MKLSHISRLYGFSPKTVTYWVKKYRAGTANLLFMDDSELDFGLNSAPEQNG